MWDKALTRQGVPFYISHNTGTTQWEHPDLLTVYEQFDEIDSIEYAAYRTAAKLRAVQKAIYVDLLDLSNVQDFFRVNDYAHELNPVELKKLLIQLYSYQKQKDVQLKFNCNTAAELTLNWIILLLDENRHGILETSAVETIIVLMCHGGVSHKHRYLYHLHKSRTDILTMNSCRKFLKTCLTIPRQLKEEMSFSAKDVAISVEGFMKMNSSDEYATENEFHQWMIQEPQIIVWIPTLHRLTVSENTRHDSKCNVCKRYPIIGFRYRCLKCFNMDMCQNCFWAKRMHHKHRPSHPIQEYCTNSTQAEDLKDFSKILKHKVIIRRKRKNTRKQRYLSQNQNPSNDVVEYQPRIPSIFSGSQTRHDSKASFSISFNESSYTDGVDDSLQTSNQLQDNMTSNNSRVNTTHLSNDQRFEMEKVMASLENDNRVLERDIRHLQEEQNESEQQRRLQQNQNRRQIQELKNGKEKLFAKQEILEDHNRQLELQLQKLKMILQQVHEESELCRTKDLK